MAIRIFTRGEPSSSKVFTGMYNTEPEHDWEVYSTVPGAILVQCRDCDLRGYIEVYSDEEWYRAFYAPSNPYRWNDPDRVVLDITSRRG